ncbi:MULTISPECIES: DNA topoisomerase IV subunit A [Acetobacter]|uniref:DNA topoisomerase 4 subunit A n=2 Tax=Acetobacter TaxID=434 RepID=A0AAN1PGU2_9PROT|nr:MULTISPECIES: DNA topoisomerase IV subunit A [Acetobacter]ASL40784.1 DNA topoisomerase IV subunit A [Acetobacter oryzifermentans]AXM99869.1 DNA topoisomerase IV subunit A [Acetobacter pomorum]KAA8383426.1 DNA topoisomerase IV subunit A [Acetobacter sp. DmW_136]KAA8391706.1 DNA topoisomerase IV subunit A [Acetobacter sp. DmW_125124]KAA8394902.1 DNA topoisomerase IV subunit A [Acetobacter sp. DmW_125127]
MSETAGHIEETKLAEALSERYLAYALSTIMSRSLPDVRDGLKPVHRRLVYAMHQLRLDPASGFKKCARVVGDVIGKFHPHGDASVYEALVRLAQDFAARYPLVEGQGNFGSVDGDNPAAMRYTEARLTEVAVALLDGIEDDAVDFRPTYDGEEQEPVVLPSAFPNLLANGAAGIAVGMATSIPPHNAAEVCAAAALLVRKPSATTQELLELMPGPDFPTGGLIVEDSDAILQAYETGRGSFRMRARWEVEQGRFSTWHIVVTQIPYQVQKSRLIEQIADLLDQKKLPLLGDIRDESTDEIRLILEPKTRGIEPEVLMETLFRATPLESRFGLNMNVLGADRSPGVMGLKQVIQAWLNHRHEVLERRSRHRLTAVERRLEILSGFLAVYLNLDEVIRIIREEDDAKASLIATFKLTDLQAESVLNMRLRSLRRLEEMEIRKEHDALSAEQAALMALLDSEKQRWKTIERELTTMIKAFGKGRLGERRSTILSAPKPVDISVVEEVEREPLTMILSQKGWVRAVKGHNVDLENQKFKEGDALKLAIPCQTSDRLCFFATDGRAYTVKGADLPRGRGDGQPIRLLIDLSNDEDLLAVFPIEDGKRRLVASSAGRGMLVEEEALVAEKRSGRQVLNLKEGEFARICVPAEGDHVAVVGDNRRFLIFPLEQLPVMARGLGVALQKYSDGGGLRQAVVFTAADGLHWPGTARVRQFADLQDWVSRRAAVGKVAPPWAGKKP